MRAQLITIGITLAIVAAAVVFLMRRGIIARGDYAGGVFEGSEPGAWF